MALETAFNLKFATDLNLLKTQVADATAVIDQLAVHAQTAANSTMEMGGKEAQSNLVGFVGKLGDMEKATRAINKVEGDRIKALEAIDKQINIGLVTERQRDTLTRNAYAAEIRQLEGIRANLALNSDETQIMVDRLKVMEQTAVDGAKSSGAGMTEFELKIRDTVDRFKDLTKQFDRLKSVPKDFQAITTAQKGSTAGANAFGNAVNKALIIVGLIVAAFQILKAVFGPIIDGVKKWNAEADKTNKLTKLQQETYQNTSRTLEEIEANAGKVSGQVSESSRASATWEVLNGKIKAGFDKIHEVMSSIVDVFTKIGEAAAWLLRQTGLVTQEEADQLASIKATEKEMTAINEAEAKRTTEMEKLKVLYDLTEKSEEQTLKYNEDRLKVAKNYLATVEQEVSAILLKEGVAESERQKAIEMLQTAKDQVKELQTQTAEVDKLQAAYDAAQKAYTDAQKTAKAQVDAGLASQEDYNNSIMKAEQARFDAMVKINIEYEDELKTRGDLAKVIDNQAALSAKAVLQAEMEAESNKSMLESSEKRAAYAAQVLQNTIAETKAAAEARVALSLPFDEWIGYANEYEAALTQAYILSGEAAKAKYDEEVAQINSNTKLTKQARQEALDAARNAYELETAAMEKAHQAEIAATKVMVAEKKKAAAEELAARTAAAEGEAKLTDQDYNSWEKYKEARDKFNEAVLANYISQENAIKANIELERARLDTIEGMSEEEKNVIMQNSIQTAEQQIKDLGEVRDAQLKTYGETEYAAHLVSQMNEVVKGSEDMAKAITMGAVTGYKNAEGASGAFVKGTANAAKAATKAFASNLGLSEEVQKDLDTALTAMAGLGDALMALSEAMTESIEEVFARLDEQFAASAEKAKAEHEQRLALIDEEYQRTMEQLGFVEATTAEGKAAALAAAIESGDAKAIYEEEQRQLQLEKTEEYNAKVNAENTAFANAEAKAEADLQNSKNQAQYEADQQAWEAQVATQAVNAAMSIGQAIVAAMSAASVSFLAAPAVFAAFSAILIGLAVAQSAVQMAAIMAQKPKQPKKIQPKLIESAQGNVFESGGVVDEYMTQPLASMAESGPEAIMPLSRDSSGDLGVNASGIGGPGQVNIYLDSVLIGSKVVEAINSGQTIQIETRMITS